MAINFLPISFHDSRMASDGLGAGFGGAAFLASCAKAGIAASITATSRAPHLLTLFIVPLLVFFVCFWTCDWACFGPGWAGTPSLTDSMAKRFSPSRANPGLLAGVPLTTLSGAIIRRHGKSTGADMVDW